METLLKHKNLTKIKSNILDAETVLFEDTCWSYRQSEDFGLCGYDFVPNPSGPQLLSEADLPFTKREIWSSVCVLASTAVSKYIHYIQPCNIQ